MKKLGIILCVLLAAAQVMTGCASSEKNAETTTQAETTQVAKTEAETTAKATETTEAETTKAETTEAATAAPIVVANYAKKFNIQINPEVELLTDDNNVITGVEFKNEDAENAYADLDLIGLPIEEATEQIVVAATEQGYMSDGHQISLSVVDTDAPGQEALEDMTAIKETTQKVLTDYDFELSPIHAGIGNDETVLEDDTCDLCLGSGLVLCDLCEGTTFLDGLAWTICGMCSGSGSTLCSNCEGAGQYTCGECGGSGKDENSEDGLCVLCKGSGMENCFRCDDASGYQVCYDCKGAGKLGGLPCPRCNGQLWMVCNRCNGTGKKN